MIDVDRIARLRRLLLKWGDEYREPYPWRQTQDPYRIIMAEFMLHRTQASQAEKVYRDFTQRYATLSDAVNADPEELKELLYPLGLHWRIEGILEALHFLWERHRGIPTDMDELMATPGIGPYIASATLCFSRNEPLVLVDTNTVRVTGRVFGLNLAGEARRRKEMLTAIGEACDPERPRDYYYSMIDLAHKLCTPTQPRCSKCPLLNVPCQYGQQHLGESP